MPLHFADSASPENIPSGMLAAVYINGYAWTEAEKKRMSRIRSISVLRESHFARQASIIDVESGAALNEDVVPFIHARKSYGYDDATAYCNRSNYDEIRERVHSAGLSCLYWVATLDGTVDIPDVWAVQFETVGHQAYDLSVLFGHDWFHRP